MVCLHFYQVAKSVLTFVMRLGDMAAHKYIYFILSQ